MKTLLFALALCGACVGANQASGLQSWIPTLPRENVVHMPGPISPCVRVSQGHEGERDKLFGDSCRGDCISGRGDISIAPVRPPDVPAIEVEKPSGLTDYGACKHSLLRRHAGAVNCGLPGCADKYDILMHDEQTATSVLVSQGG